MSLLFLLSSSPMVVDGFFPMTTHVLTQKPQCEKILQDAERLPATDGAFGNGYAVGLGGGIEVAIDDDFCKRMLFRSKNIKNKNKDAFQGECDNLHEVIVHATGFWADRPPSLFFK